MASATFISATPAGAADPVVGAGSTFAAVALEQWAGDVYADGLTVDYRGNGSVRGLEQFQQGVVDFAASDVPYPPGTDGQRAYAYVPIVAGGTALTYNLPDRSGAGRITDLRLSPETIADIFFGTIRTWAHPQILDDNPALVDRLPDLEIKLAVRTPGAGTSAVFTDFLSTAAPARWNEFVARSGASTLDNGNYVTAWPESNAQFNCWCNQYPGSNEIANEIARNVPSARGTIGYVEAAYAKHLGLPVARTRNQAGFYRLPNARSVAIALLEATENGDGTQNLENVHLSPREEAYPISSYTSLVIPIDDAGGFSLGKGETLSRFLIYAVTEGQGSADFLGYSPLPPNLVQFALDRVALIPGAVPAPPLGDWGRFYEDLVPESPPPPGTGQYVAEYAEATFARRGTELRVAPGQVDDGGRPSEELEIDVRNQRCSSRTLVTTDVSLRATGADLDGVVLDARAGTGFVFGTFALVGQQTVTPAGRSCARPESARAVTNPIEVSVTLTVNWRNARGSVPDVYGGADCGGTGTCYYRVAAARASWSSDGLGTSRAGSRSAFFFEATYPLMGPSGGGG